MLAVNLDLKGKTVLMAGGGGGGRRKLEAILRAGAAVRVIEPAPDARLAALAEQNAITLEGEFRPELLEGVSLVFAATSDRAFNRELARAARQRGIWANIADQPAEGDFFLPAVIERGQFRLAVSTGGLSPALAAVAAERLRKLFGPEYGRLLSLLGRLRPPILAAGLTGEERRAVFRRLAESETLLAILAEGDEGAGLEYVKTLLPPNRIDLESL